MTKSPIFWLAIGAAGLFAVQKFTGRLIPSPMGGMAASPAAAGKRR